MYRPRPTAPSTKPPASLLAGNSKDLSRPWHQPSASGRPGNAIGSKPQTAKQPVRQPTPPSKPPEPLRESPKPPSEPPKRTTPSSGNSVAWSSTAATKRKLAEVEEARPPEEKPPEESAKVAKVAFVGKTNSAGGLMPTSKMPAAARPSNASGSSAPPVRAAISAGRAPVSSGARPPPGKPPASLIEASTRDNSARPPPGKPPASLTEAASQLKQRDAVGKAAPPVAKPPAGPPKSIGQPAPRPLTPAPPKVAPKLGREGATSSSSESNKWLVKMRKVEALTKSLLDEWTSLPKDKQEECFRKVADGFVKRVPTEYLALMAEQFGNAADRLAVETGGNGSAGGNDSSANNSRWANRENKEATNPEPSPEQMEELEEQMGPDGSMEAEEDVAIPADDSEQEKFAEAMRQMLREVGSKPPRTWAEAWQQVVPSAEEEVAALTALLEVAASGAGSQPDLAPRIITELARTKTVQIPNVQRALQSVAGRLEQYVQAHENAWHVHSDVLLLLFPKIGNSTWGFTKQPWTWMQWWTLVEAVLSKADHFRAFDILILVLQRMQEKSGQPIKNQKVWQEAGRAAKVRKRLCAWGEMDESSITETLAAYEVEI